MATTALLLPPLNFREEDSNGQPLAFGTIQSFQAGTVTPVATYTDSTGATPNANPLTLNNRGEANIWVLPNVNYKFLVKDSAGNQIRVVDNVQNSQLISLYGGVDTGVANAYVLTFTASFSSYTDGIVLYWVPSHTNTGGSTINVNGLGVVSILNQNLGGLAAGQLVAGQTAVIIYKGGNFLLQTSGQTSNSSGSGSLTPTGLTTAPGCAFKYDINGSTAMLFLGGCTGVSNSTSFTLTGLPTNLRPVQTQTVSIAGLFTDNTVIQASTEAKFTGGSDTITFTKLQNAAAFTAAGLKGLQVPISVAYLLG